MDCVIKYINGEEFEMYRLDMLTDSDKLNLIGLLEFDVVRQKENNILEYRLVDLQGANLGGIEDETFYSIDSIIDRLDIYWEDYKIVLL